MTHLYLIRHGEATTQTNRSLQDDGLTPLGIKQAQHLRDRLAATHEIAADVLIASTFPRARQTAEIIAPALQLPIIFDDEVQEMRAGEATGMLLDAFEAKYGRSDFERDPFRPVAPTGEFWGQFVLRASAALDRIIRQYEGKCIVVVCHGGIVDSSFLYFFGMNTLQMPRTHFFTENTSITYWRKDYREHRPPVWRLVRYNDNLHVRDIDATVHIPWESLPLPRKPEHRLAQPSMPPSEK